MAGTVGTSSAPPPSDSPIDLSLGPDLVFPVETEKQDAREKIKGARKRKKGRGENKNGRAQEKERKGVIERKQGRKRKKERK